MKARYEYAIAEFVPPRWLSSLLGVPIGRRDVTIRRSGGVSRLRLQRRVALRNAAGRKCWMVRIKMQRKQS